MKLTSRDASNQSGSFTTAQTVHLQRPAVLQQQQQQQQGQTSIAQTQSVTSLASRIQPITSISSVQSHQARQQKLRLQRLQIERERLKMRQQEIMRQEQEQARIRQQGALGQQEMLLRQSLGEDHSSPTTEIPSPGMDPFLSGTTDFHTRQESADSGLGMGNSYSLPHTPEDFLSNMDDNMDGVNEGGSVTEMGLDGPDISSLGSDNIDSTDDLVPSLQLSEEFSSEILDDVQSLINQNKPDNVLTWL